MGEPQEYFRIVDFVLSAGKQSGGDIHEVNRLLFVVGPDSSWSEVFAGGRIDNKPFKILFG